MKRIKRFMAFLGSFIMMFSFSSCSSSKNSKPSSCVCGNDPCTCEEAKPDSRLRVTVINGIGGGLYEPNTTANIFAEVPKGSTFLHWTEEDRIFSEKNPCVFTVSKNVTLTAVFVSNEPPKPKKVKVNVVNGTGGGEFEIGSTALVRGDVPSGSAFAVWMNSDSVVSTKQDYSFIVQKETTLTAVVYNKSQLPQPSYYTNPVIKADRPDPSIIRKDNTFYMYTTSGYTPNLNASTDLVNWSTLNLGSSFVPYAGTNGSGTWAPDIAKIGDKYNLYYSRSTWGDSNPGLGVSSSDSPSGPWQNHGKLFSSKEIGVDNSIDPTVFIGQDGKVYIIWGSFQGVFGIELTKDGLGFADGSLSKASANKTLIAGIVGNWDGDTYEAPYVIFKDGYYYLFVSSGTCCEGKNSTYRVRVGRSKNPLGPYVGSDNRDMLGRNRGDLVLQRNGTKVVGPGHNSIVVDDIGQYFIVYHMFIETSDGIYNETEGSGPRWVAIDKLNWNEEGWPSVNGGVASVTQQQAPVFFKR